MKSEICIIKINDEEIPALYPDIISLEVEDDHQLASIFKIKLAIQLQRDGTWTYIDDEHLTLWNKVEISAGFPDNVIKIMTGYITHLKPYFAQNITGSYLEVFGMDKSVLMDREEKLKAWPEKKDSDIAREIFSEYDLSPKTDDTNVVHEEAVSTIIQRETDIKFLKRLARRNGYECFVENNSGYFRKPVLTEPPQKILAIHFGNETNLSFFQADLNLLQPVAVGMYQIDSITKDIRRVQIKNMEQRQLGRNPNTALLPSEIPQTKLYLKQTVTTNRAEMQALCQGVYDESAWILEGNGEVNGNLYQDVLRSKRLVTIKGIGERYSGTYYVTNVRHSFDSNGYVQHFKVRKNAVCLDGTEDFGAGGSLLSRI